MDKNAIFDEFKKNKEAEKVNEEVKNTEVETLTKDTEIQKVPKTKKNNKNKKRYNKNKNKNKTNSNEHKSPFELWKENFLKEQINQEFLSTLEFYRKRNFNLFSNDEYFEIKYNNPKARCVIVDPTNTDLNIGKGGDFYLIKGLTIFEYEKFIKEIGARDEHPEEFLRYTLENAVLYPSFKDIDLKEIGAGTIMTLYKNILDYSDLTKTVRIFEV